MESESNTTLATWAMAVREALGDYGVDPEPVFADAGISLAAISDPLGRIPHDAMASLWQAAIAATGDEAFGLKVSSHVTPSTFFILGIAAITSENALDALELGSHFASMVANAAYVRIDVDGGKGRLELGSKPGFPRFSPSAVHVSLAGIIRISRQYLGLNVPLDKVTFEHEPPAHPEVFEEWFGCPVEFGAAHNAIYSSRIEDLFRQMPTANSALRQMNEKLLLDYVSQLSEQSIVTRVRNELSIRLENGEDTDQKAIARAVAMSERKLQTNLKSEGTSFQEMLDAARKRKAIHLLTVEKLSVSQVALQLGFKEVSSFTRAFKRWTGKTPREYVK